MASRKKPGPTGKGLYRNYIRNCRLRNIFWGLELAEFEKLTKQNCAYCDRPPVQVWNRYVYNGIDRKDNKQGYVPGNVVTACKDCNAVKSDRYSYDQMKKIGQVLQVIWAEKPRRKK
jgi:hypothetical protein